MDPIARLKQRQPWAGHWGQRALVPGAGIRLFASFKTNWKDFALYTSCVVVAMGFFLGFADTAGIVGWAGWIGGVGFFLLIVALLRGVAWDSVARPLDDGEIRDFKSILDCNPVLMEAAMHWLNPQAMLRQKDMRLLRGAQRYFEKTNIDKPQVSAQEARDLLLDGIQQKIASEELTALAMQMARRRAKPFKLGGLFAGALALFTKQAPYWPHDLKKSWRDWIDDTVLYYFMLVMVSYLTQSLMGVSLKGDDIMTPFGVTWLTPLLVLVSLCFPLAKILARKRLPLPVSEIMTLTNKGLFASGAAYHYLSHIPKGLDWSAYDITGAWKLDIKTHQEALGDATKKETKETTLPPLDPSCPLPVKKPWQGHWGQRLLIPSKAVRALGDDLASRRSVAIYLVVLTFLFLFVPAGSLLTDNATFSFKWCLGVIVAAGQIELLRLLGYLTVSGTVSGPGDDLLNPGYQSKKSLGEIIPGGKPTISSWIHHPSQLRVWDVRVLEKCADKYRTAEDKKSEQLDLDGLLPGQTVRESILNHLHSQIPILTQNTQAQHQAKTAKAPVDLWRVTRKFNRDAWDVFEIATLLFSKHPRLAMLLVGVLIVVHYLAVCGLAWAVSWPWMDTIGLQIGLPLGRAGTVYLAVGAACLMGLGFYLLQRSIAPKIVLDFFVEEDGSSEDAGYCLDYLAHLPIERHWTFQDLFRARKLIQQQERKNEHEREEARQSHSVSELMETREARVGLSKVQSEQLTQAAVEVVEPQPGTSRRRL